MAFTIFALAYWFTEDYEGEKFRILFHFPSPHGKNPLSLRAEKSLLKESGKINRKEGEEKGQLDVNWMLIGC